MKSGFSKWRFAAAFLSASTPALLAQQPAVPALGSNGIKSVLLISIDGMHALDYANCVHGVGGSSAAPTCPTLAQLGQSGVTYVQASTAKPSDSFPGLTAIVTGASPRTAGVYYDVSYDRALSPPAKTTPFGIPGGANLCPGTRGTQVGFEEELGFDYTKIDAGGGINPDYLPRDPNRGCAPVYPHNFLRVNTIFEVIKSAGGYTAWSDKHPAYELVNGPSGVGVNDLFVPEINSTITPLPSVPGCSPLPDKAVAADSDWTGSFQNIQCYDTLKVQAVINQIDGKTHDGSAAAPVPAILGMNFQAVSVGQKLVEAATNTQGGYLDAAGTPTPALLNEIQFVDSSIGKMVAELKAKGLYNSTLIIITAKHGQSPININSLVRIPRDNKALAAPSDILGNMVAQSVEDDASLIWLKDQNQTTTAVNMLQSNLATVGGGEIFFGRSLSLLLADPSSDSRPPDILVTPNVGVVYTGGAKKVSEHGGFSNDDTNVIMLVANPALSGSTITSSVATAQVAPTILKALGLNPQSLQGVQKEGTQVLPGLPY